MQQIKVSLAVALVALSLGMEGTRSSRAASNLPDATRSGVVEKLFRLDCGRSLANDESVWTPGKNVGDSIEFSSTCGS
jgi:N-acyl homoserine lactone hydrolase